MILPSINSLVAIVLLRCGNCWAILPLAFTCVPVGEHLPTKNQCENSQLMWVYDCKKSLLPRKTVFCTLFPIFQLLYSFLPLLLNFPSALAVTVCVLCRAEYSSNHHYHFSSELWISMILWIHCHSLERDFSDWGIE